VTAGRRFFCIWPPLSHTFLISLHFIRAQIIYSHPNDNNHSGLAQYPAVEPGLFLSISPESLGRTSECQMSALDHRYSSLPTSGPPRRR
jgi:hypothetical protein